MNITTKPTEEKQRMSDSEYRKYLIRLKANAKKAWKKSIFAQGLTVRQYEHNTPWMNFEIWQFVTSKKQLS